MCLIKCWRNETSAIPFHTRWEYPNCCGMDPLVRFSFHSLLLPYKHKYTLSYTYLYVCVLVMSLQYPKNRLLVPLMTLSLFWHNSYLKTNSHIFNMSPEFVVLDKRELGTQKPLKPPAPAPTDHLVIWPVYSEEWK